MDDTRAANGTLRWATIPRPTRTVPEGESVARSVPRGGFSPVAGAQHVRLGQSANRHRATGGDAGRL